MRDVFLLGCLNEGIGWLMFLLLINMVRLMIVLLGNGLEFICNFVRRCDCCDSIGDIVIGSWRKIYRLRFILRFQDCWWVYGWCYWGVRFCRNWYLSWWWREDRRKGSWWWIVGYFFILIQGYVVILRRWEKVDCFCSAMFICCRWRCGCRWDVECGCFLLI